MTRRVLVPIDGSSHADAALEYACTALADAEITVLFVLDLFGYYEERDGVPDRLDDWYANLERRADRLFEEAGEHAAEHGVEIDTATEQGRPDRAIVAHAAEISRASFWGAFEDRIRDLRANQNITRSNDVTERVTRRSPVAGPGDGRPLTVTPTAFIRPDDYGGR